jgi:hypothetical protein
MEVTFGKPGDNSDKISGRDARDSRDPRDIPAWKPPMLPDPPRRVPIMLQLRMMFGGALAQIGWFLFGVGMIFFWGLVVNIDYASLYRYNGKLTQIQVTITASDKTSFSEGGSKTRKGTPIYKHDFKFTLPTGKSYTNASYSVGNQLKPGENFNAEFPDGEPQHARLVGMRTKPAPIFVLFVMFFPLIGLGMVVFSLNTGLNACRLLTGGKIAGGVLRNKEPTNTRINGRRVYKLTFDFRAEDGKNYIANAKNHVLDKLEDDYYEPLLYDPLDPTRSVLLGNLPGTVFVDEHGEMHVENPGMNIPSLVIPMLVITANLMWFITQYLQP